MLDAAEPGYAYKGWRLCSACYEAVSGAKTDDVAPPPPLIPSSPVYLTTAPHLEGFRILETVDVITSECVFGLNVFKDMLAGLTDFVGGRSGTTQNALRAVRLTCLNELRAEARALGANAVIAIDLDYSEFSGQGKSMLFLVASGTAVIVEPVHASAITAAI